MSEGIPVKSEEDKKKSNDIREAAAARRAKILSKDKDRLLAAKGEKVFEATPSTPDAEDAGSIHAKERPLASRRNKIREMTDPSAPIPDVAQPDLIDKINEEGKSNKSDHLRR